MSQGKLESLRLAAGRSRHRIALRASRPGVVSRDCAMSFRHSPGATIGGRAHSIGRAGVVARAEI